MNKPKAAIDTAAIAALLEVVHLGFLEDLTPVVGFIKQNGLERVFKNVASFSATNEMGQLNKATLGLARILEIVNFVLFDKNIDGPADQALQEAFADAKPVVDEFYTMLCGNLKTIYKIFSLRKPTIVASACKVLLNLVAYRNGPLFSQLVDNFEWAHQAVQRILVPSRDDFAKKIADHKSMRAAFLEFLLATCTKANATMRKALLTNTSITTNWWKHVEMDSYESLNTLFAFLETSVLNERAYKRATKCKILNSHFFHSMAPLFAFVKAENPRAVDNDDINDFKAFKTNFIQLLNTLVSDRSRGVSFPPNDLGLDLDVNGVHFTINNKLLYSVLTMLKPWDQYAQLQFVMTILNHNQELVPPYMQWIVSSSGGYHEPALSSYWIGHTLLYTEILRSQHLPKKAAYVALAPLSKTALANCLIHPSTLINQLGLQLCLLQVQRLKNAPQAEVEPVLEQLPPHAALIPFLTHKEKLLRLTATSIMAQIELVAPGTSSQATVAVLLNQLADLNERVDKCTTFELLLLEKYLSIQLNNDLKWWNKPKAGNSFFVSLLKLGGISGLADNITQILHKLVGHSLLFNELRLVASPLPGLIESCRTLKQDSPVWNCLDETIARAVKSPYKYLDQSHLHYSDLSVFVVALFEQSKFIPDYNTNKEVGDWILVLCTRLVVIGEPRQAIEKLASDSKVLLNIDMSAITVKDKIMSRVQFAEAVYLLNKAVEKSDNSRIFEIFEKLGAYLSSTELDKLHGFLLDPENWVFFRKITSEGFTDSDMLAASLWKELIIQLDILLTGSKMQLYIADATLVLLPKKNQALVARFLEFLTEEQLTKASETAFEVIFTSSYRELIKRGSEVDFEFLKLAKIKDLESLLENVVPSPNQVPLIYEYLRFHFMFEKPLPEFQAFLELKDLSDDLLYRVAGVYPSLFTKHQPRAVALALLMKDWTKSLRMFAAYPEAFDSAQVQQLVFSESSASLKDTMTLTFVDFLQTVSGSEVDTWFQKAVLYVTRKLAESPTLSPAFIAFLQALRRLIADKPNHMKNTQMNVVDAQLEVVLSHKLWVQNPEVLAYANAVVLSRKLSFAKLLLMFITNEKNVLHQLPRDNGDVRFQLALMIYLLYKSAPNQTSPELIKLVLAMYMGSTRAEDLLLKQVLVGLESKHLQSWVDFVTGWDITEEINQDEVDLVGEEKFIIVDKSSLIVALNKKFIYNTINNVMEVPAVPESKAFGDYMKFYKQFTPQSHQDTVYDPELLMLIIISNEELFKELETGGVFDVAKLVNSNFLQFVVAALANTQVRDVAKVVLARLLKSLNENTSYKERNVMRIYVSSVLHTTRVADHTTPVAWYLFGALSPILGNPGHFLYEHASRYVLATPTLKPGELPLFSSLTLGADREVGDDNYYREVTWVITQMANGVKTYADLRLLRHRDVFETVLNLCNSPYKPDVLHMRVLQLLHAVDAIANGPHMLVTNHGAFAGLETLKRTISGDFAEQQRLNVDQVALRLGMASLKRVREWMDSDVKAAVKRIHAA